MTTKVYKMAYYAYVSSSQQQTKQDKPQKIFENLFWVWSVRLNNLFLVIFSASNNN